MEIDLNIIQICPLGKYRKENHRTETALIKRMNQESNRTDG